LVKQKLLKEASDLCLENARKLLRDADLLFAFKSYGSALALVTIGNEEFGKAVIYKLLSQDFITEKSIPKNFHQYLKEENYQALASQSCWMGLALASCAHEFGDMIYSLIGKMKNINFEHNENPLSSTEETQVMELIKNLGDHLVDCQRYYKNIKKGLYVTLDYVDENALSPLEVSESEVQKIVSESRERLTFVEPFFNITVTEKQKRIVIEFFKKAYDIYHFEHTP
jgi:AbiV family abortive infection protein